MPLFQREIGYREAVQHIPEELLERYSMGTLPEPEAGLIEEHLLICTECQDQLQAADEFVATFRAAAGRVARSGS